MKIKKFTTAGALALSLALLCSCSQTASSSVAETSSAATTQTTKVTTTTAESTPDTSSQAQNKAPADITPVMWTVTSPDGNTMTLTGSMHALKDDDYPLPDKLMDEYNNADVLAVECDTLSYSTDVFAQLALAKEMMYDDGTTLKDVLSDEAWTALSEYVKTFGLDISTFSSYKPWAMSSVLDSYLVMSSGLDTTKGLDSYLLQTAHDENKEIYEVESVDFQMDMMMNFSDDIYDMMFSLYKGETKETQTQALLDMYTAWRSGDISTIETDSEDVTSSDLDNMTDAQLNAYNDYENQMLYDRNIGMEEAIKTLLDEDKNVFYVVGAAHFTGEKGIISLLENDGYTVEQIKY